MSGGAQTHLVLTRERVKLGQPSRFLMLVKTYPIPSHKYEETVCCAERQSGAESLALTHAARPLIAITWVVLLAACTSVSTITDPETTSATSLLPGPSVELPAICSPLAALKQLHEEVNSFMAANTALDVARLGTFHQTARKTMLQVAQELDRAYPDDVLVGSVRNWMVEIDHTMSQSESYLLFQFDAVKAAGYVEDAVYWFDRAEDTWNQEVVAELEIKPECE